MSNEVEVTLPKLGESIMNATIIQWFKKEGDAIKKDEPLLEVATDKVNSEIPSPVSGVVKSIVAGPDQELNVGELMAIITVEGAVSQEEAPKAAVPAVSAPSSDENKDYYSPALLRIARENNVSLDELSKIKGTGEGGRITKKDLEAHIERKGKPCLAAPPKEGEEHVKMGPLRKAIAENMVKSFYEAPHATLITEVDVTNLSKKVKEEKQAFLAKHGVKLSITSYVARAITKALKEFPWLNASLSGDTIIVKKDVNLGIAVSVEQGVMVPVIRGCEKLELHEISAKIADFASKARTNTLNPDDVQEGTITMTNYGMTGIQLGIPIIRYPEVAIIGLGAIERKVVAFDDENFGVRKMMNVSVTFDHRVIDGIYGCGFLNAMKNELEIES